MTARIMTYASTPFVSKLSARYNYSSLICTGGVILFTSLFLSTFTSKLWQLALTYGALVGISAALIMTPGLLAISLYFKKRRALAISMYFTIGGASGLVIPLLFEILLNNYQLGGAFLIYSAMSLNIVPFGILIRQPNWMTPRQRNLTSISESEIEQNGIEAKKNVTSATKKMLLTMVSNTRNDLHIFKDPVFLVLLISRVLIMMPVLNIIQFIPDFVDKDLPLGLNKMAIAVLLSVTSIGDTCARILTGTIIDKLPWPMKYTFAVLAAGIGGLIIGFVMVRSYALLLALHIIFGLLLGIIIVMQHILEGDLMGVEKTPLSHGITQLLAGLASVVMMYLVGYFRDVTGSYKIGFYLMGLSAILAGGIWLLEPCFVRCLPPRIRPTKSIDKFPEAEIVDAIYDRILR
uniref:Major facilitator superfamily (MFS) profile domain-containing protein n=1 Tax=Strigamia maritima TaxID=126957 RepID=T1J6I7_STRMM